MFIARQTFHSLSSLLSPFQLCKIRHHVYVHPRQRRKRSRSKWGLGRPLEAYSESRFGNFPGVSTHRIMRGDPVGGQTSTSQNSACLSVLHTDPICSLRVVWQYVMSMALGHGQKNLSTNLGSVLTVYVTLGCLFNLWESPGELQSCGIF